MLATDAPSTGQRTIHHEVRGSRVLLFVREQRKQDGCAGGPTGTSFSWPSDPQAKRRPIRAMDHDDE